MDGISMQRAAVIAEQFEKLDRVEKQAAAARTTGVSTKEDAAIAADLSRAAEALHRGAGRSGEGLQLLRAGEGALAEVRDSLDRMAELIRLSDGASPAEREAMQEELNSLLDGVERILKDASWGDMTLFRGEDEGLVMVLDSLGQLLGSSGGSLDGLAQLLDGLGGMSGQSLLDTLFASLAEEELAAPVSNAPDAVAQPETPAPAGHTAPGRTGTRQAAPPPPQATPFSAGQTASAPQSAWQARAFGGIQAAGLDLSGVSFDPASGVVTVGGSEPVELRGAPANTQGHGIAGPLPQGRPHIVLTGSGPVTLADITAPSVTVKSPDALLEAEGANLLGEVRMAPGASLTLGGAGTAQIGRLTGNGTNTVMLNGGAASVDGGREGFGEDIVLIQLAHTSLAAQASAVRSPEGEAAKLADLLWKLIPDQSILASLREDPSHGYPIHTVELQSRDDTGQTVTRSAWLRWDDTSRRFVEIDMYPNPFAVTGGEPGEDWTYDQGTRTLYIRTPQVTGLSGGAGLDAGGSPFCGRVVLESHLEPVTLTLDGVDCRPGMGRALDLGRENDVTLLLADDSVNTFAGGPGCAGISLGDGACLTVDLVPPPLEEDSGENGEADETAPDRAPKDPLPPGALIASGGKGGAGIGRDCGGSWDRVSRITIRGGTITASGGGGGAGIGAGAHGFMGDISITGGTVTAQGGDGGGAGIGAGLGAPAGDISITGGRISASAAYHAAAIGAAVEGECGNVTISAPARLLRAEGGSPDAAIGACRFGRCGEVHISPGVDVGGIPLGRAEPDSIPLQLGGETVRLPRFVLTPRILRLRGLDLTTREGARAAGTSVDAANRHLSLVQETYNALYSQLTGGGQGSSYEDTVMQPVRTTGDAGALLAGAKRSLLREPARSAAAHSGQEQNNVLKLIR